MCCFRETRLISPSDQKQKGTCNMAGAVEGNRSLQLLLRQALLSWQHAMAQHLFGIQQDGKVSALAVQLTVGARAGWGGSGCPGLQDFPQSFSFFCSGCRRPRLTFVVQAVACDDSPAASSAVCVVFSAHEKRTNKLRPLFFGCFRHCAPAAEDFYFLRGGCMMSGSRRARRRCFATPTAQTNLQRAT